MIEINKTAAAFIAITVFSQIILLFLKLENIINWNWEWILIPLWAPYALFIVSGILLVLYITVYNTAERIFKKHE